MPRRHTTGAPILHQMVPSDPPLPKYRLDEVTPFPWSLERTRDHGAAYRIMDEQEVTIFLCYQQPADTWKARANAEHLLHTARSFAPLVRMLEKALGHLETPGDFDPSETRWLIEDLTAVLDAAQKRGVASCAHRTNAALRWKPTSKG